MCINCKKQYKYANNDLTTNKDIHTSYICETRFTACAVDLKSTEATQLHPNSPLFSDISLDKQQQKFQNKQAIV